MLSNSAPLNNEPLDLNEVWKPIPGFEDSYQISDMGRVKSMERSVPRTDGRVCKVNEKILGNRLHVSGRGRVCLSAGEVGKAEYRFTAHLVWEAFIGPIPKGYCLHHVNGDKTNASLRNLTLITIWQAEHDSGVKAAARLWSANSSRRKKL